MYFRSIVRKSIVKSVRVVVYMLRGGMKERVVQKG